MAEPLARSSRSTQPANRTDRELLYLAPAWLCRPWRAEGYPVPPYRDFNWKGELIKASIPVRNTLWWRAAQFLVRDGALIFRNHEQ